MCFKSRTGVKLLQGIVLNDLLLWFAVLLNMKYWVFFMGMGLRHGNYS